MRMTGSFASSSEYAGHYAPGGGAVQRRAVSHAAATAVRDDGSGFDVHAESPGLGLTSMHDRLAEVAGQLSIVSSAEAGGRVIGRLPLHDWRGSPRPV
jgi:signal transduction histidine kinase